MNTVSRLIGMLKSPRTTLSAALVTPRSLDLAALIVLISAACSVSFLMTGVGRLAALDQQVRQLESLGVVIDDHVYAELRQWERYRPLLSAAGILIGWPVAWACAAALIRAIGNRAQVRLKPDTTARVSTSVSPTSVASGFSRTIPTFAQVFAVLVYSSSVFALRALVATPINYARESVGGATSLALLLPGLDAITFTARLFGALDIFVLWWVLLLALGLSMVYRTRALSIARWLFGAYAVAAVAMALTQTLRGGV